MYGHHSVTDEENDTHFLLSHRAPFLNSEILCRMSGKIKPEWTCWGQLERSISSDLDHVSQSVFCGSPVVKNINGFPRMAVGEGYEKSFSVEKYLTL